jgi:hypothetical protein
VVEPSPGERAETLASDADARRDEVRIKAGDGAAAYNLGEIAARRGLPSREVDLQNSERRSLLENPYPGLRVELGRAPLQIERVRTIGAAKRAAMCELGQQPDRCRRDGAGRG